LHEAGLALAGLKGTSVRVELGEDDAEKLGSWMGTTYDALSVTMPLKAAALAYCDELDEVAARTGALNSLLYRDGKLHGANKDGQGFIDALRGTFGMSMQSMHVVVLGAGGAARGIVDALVHDGVNSVALYARNDAKVADIVGRYINVSAHMLQYRPVDLVVNTIPEAGRNNEAAVIQGVSSETIAVDITYGSSLSSWRAMYQAAGCRTQDGTGMLAYQAALQMGWWFETQIDGAALLEVIS
jgi:shikimate dehydrogenase